MKSQAIGSLGGELSPIAKHVQRLACTADVIVWVSGDRLFATPARAAEKVPRELRVGIYGAGVLLAEIEDDVRRFRLRN